MDLENQNRVKDLTEKYGAENILVMLGASEAESSGLAAETVTAGDPTYAGCLAGVALGLATYHVTEAAFKEAVSADVYDDQVGMMEMVLDIDAIAAEMQNIRSQYGKY